MYSFIVLEIYLGLGYRRMLCSMYWYRDQTENHSDSLLWSGDIKSRIQPYIYNDQMVYRAVSYPDYTVMSFQGYYGLYRLNL